ncbi:SPOR domain-containing protein [Rhodohalobacter sp.]|uniref:SPOR domain-containing protein n=1 Tax=Rhodohalobacter sp. TaxID=1974210 RepID=UPI002ACE4ACC|nr:SPOR domain-containing protein [Rhodohalobacter sp.]MDZ7757838.1 SPOR domain-containing protein [Rhodohalobacter sp.]
MIKKCLLIIHLFLLSLSFPIIESAEAQSADQEVFLQFRHQGVVNTYVSAIYERDQFYLSVTDLFQALRIDVNVDQAAFTLSGNYLGEGNYILNLDSRRAQFADREITLSADDYLITDFGYYLDPDIFYRLFDLEFIIDFGSLAVTLESPDTMPVVAQRERELRRERLLRTQRELRRDFYPLQFDRNKSVFNAGFLDYNLTANVNQGGNSYLYSTNIGTELIGGDLQGTIFGSYSQTATSLRSSGLRWRYGVRDKDWISTVVAGQTTAEGLAPVAYTGVRLTNEPIEPRYIYDETAFTGTVEPDSEVELYRNNTLIDFTQADASGTYRFSIPLTYGTSNYTIRTYSPTGEMTTRDARLQIPFNFLPPGEINYTVNAGRVDNPIAGSTNRGMVSKANLSAGLTDRLTATGGVEYFEDFHDGLPTFTGGISTRVADSYLLSIQAANDAFYRASGSVIYPNNASINLDYTYYNTQGGIYNTSRNQSSIRANVFTPFTIGDWPLFFRWSVTNEQRETGAVTRYRVDLNSRVGRANIRFGYRDTQLGKLSFQTTPVARLNSSVTYNFSRSREIPSLLRSVFVRAQANYIPSISEIEDAELQLSRNITRRGRLQFSAGRNFIGDFNLFRFSLTFDFNAIRSNTTIRSTRNSTTLSQSLRGSIGYDSNHNNVLFTNRQQVGRSGVAMRMFIDNNSSGTYDEDDELIPENAIRIDRAGGTTFSKGDINYISQLQPYRQYNMTVNKGSITNPLLVPQIEQFSIVTDPNQYKLIEIPLYMSGIVEGKITRRMPDGTSSGLGGLRLYLRQINVPEGTEPHTEEIRTFSDGSFYTYEVPPGDYIIEPDPSQINFLNAVPNVETIEFTVEAIAEGDFVEGLEMTMLPADDPEVREPIEEVPVIAASIFGYNGSGLNIRQEENTSYSIQLGTYTTFTDAADMASYAESFTELELQIDFNSENELYTVRTVPFESYNTLLNQVLDFGRSDVNLLSVIHHYESPVNEENLHIQLSAYDTKEQASRLRDRVQSDLTDQNVFIYPDRSNNVFQVLIGPFTSRSDLVSTLHELVFDGYYSDLLAGLEEETEEVVETDLTYAISLRSFSDSESALQFIDETQEQLEEELQVIQTEDGQFQVVTERQVGNLEELREINQAITAATGITGQNIILYDRPGQQTMPPDSIDADTLTTDETEIVEILEEEEFQDVTEDPLRNIPTMELAPIRNEERLTCSYPIQVGSFGNIREASSKAEEIGKRLNEEIHIIYNKSTELFGLRTSPIGNISDAMLQLLLFREQDPLNQYAIVGLCTERKSSVEETYARFIIPISQFDLESDAAQFSNEIADEFEIQTNIRQPEADEAEPFTVIAGPFEDFKMAEQVQERLLENGKLAKPGIEVDPETSLPLNLMFRIYLGEISDTGGFSEKSTEYFRSTGRRLSIETDQESIRVFDQSEYRSWARFIEIFEEVRNSTGLQPLEIFILD